VRASYFEKKLSVTLMRIFSYKFVFLFYFMLISFIFVYLFSQN